MNEDKTLQQLARDVRYLAYVHGKPNPVVIAFALVIAGILGLVFFVTFIAEISAVLSGKVH